MQIIPLEKIFALYDQEMILSATRTALIRHAMGEVVSPMPGQLLFNEPPGDCHIKYGHIIGDPYFVIKIATGFYHNVDMGLPSFNGLMLVMDARTGFPLALLQDEGWLTSWRTVAAGTLATLALKPSNVQKIGIFGTGQQAQLHAEWLAATTGIRDFVLYGRTPSRTEQLATRLSEQGLMVQIASHAEEIPASCQIIVTATASTTPLFRAESVLPGTHITALGADSPGKQELDPALFARAALVAVDDHDQCMDHGDLAHAIKKGIVPATTGIQLGTLLENPTIRRRQETDITIADLTGLPAQDIAIASLFFKRLQPDSH